MYYTILGRIEVRKGADGMQRAVVNQYHSTVVHQNLYDMTEFVELIPKICKGVSNALTVQLFEGIVVNRSQDRIVLGEGFFIEDEESAKTFGVHREPKATGEFERVGA